MIPISARTRIPARLTAALAAVALVVTLWSPCAAHAAPLSTTVLTADGRPVAMYIISATPTEITYSLDASGAAPRTMSRDQIAELTIHPPEGWAQLQNMFDAGAYAEAVESLGQTAETYAGLRAVRDSIGSVAKLYHLIALKATGDFATLAREVDALADNPLTLNEHFEAELDFLRAWALYGRERWPQLEQFLTQFEHEQAPGELASKPFRDIGLPKVAELNYLRGRLRENQGNREGAISDYYAAMTVNLGSQQAITRAATMAALRLTHEALQEDPNHPTATFEAHALAVLAQRFTDNGELPVAFRGYLERPEGLPGTQQRAAAPAEDEDEDEGEGEGEGEDEGEDEAGEDA